MSEWIQLYVKRELTIMEESITFNKDEESQKSQEELQDQAQIPENSSNSRILAKGTDNYLVKIRLAKNIPSNVAMFGLKIKVSNDGIKKICERCYGYHRRNTTSTECQKSDFENYKQIFWLDNTWIPHAMSDFPSSEDNDYTFDNGFLFEELDEDEDLVDLEDTHQFKSERRG
jgi:hypothetical protein